MSDGGGQCRIVEQTLLRRLALGAAVAFRMIEIE